MSNTDFQIILEKLLPYRANINYFTLLGLGETLIDKGLIDKIKLVKKYGFSGIGVYSNGTLLTEEISKNLLNAGLDTLILSVDGISKETQNAIRIGSDIDIIKKNIDSFLHIRRSNKKNRTKLVMKFTEQEINKGEWPEYFAYWGKLLEAGYGDIILRNYVHSFNNKKIEFKNYFQIDINEKCKEVFERLSIYQNGNLGLCCGDQFEQYQNGNIFQDDPIKLYNERNFKKFRTYMEKGRITELDICSNCDILHTNLTRKLINIQSSANDFV